MYAYVHNDPLNLVDPTGLTPDAPGGNGGGGGNLLAAGAVGVAVGANVLGFPEVEAAEGIGAGGAAVLGGIAVLMSGDTPKTPSNPKVSGGTGDPCQSLGDCSGSGGPNAGGSVDPNKLNHIFGNAGHNLDPLVAEFGSQENAFSALQQSTQSAVEKQGIQGVFETQVQVGTRTVTVRGIFAGGSVRIGTAFIP